MPITESETSFEFELPNAENIPESVRDQVLEEIAEFLRDSILDYVGEGKSPVAGGRYRSTLNKDYADREKGGDTMANLDLNGDMLNALEYRIEDDKVIVGIFDEDQAIKSYAHNTGYEGHPTLEGKGYIRQFIPKEDQLLKAEIIRGVKRIIEEYLDEQD
jgi:phage gpG-like protein